MNNKNNIKIIISTLLLCYIIFLFNVYIFYKNECRQNNQDIQNNQDKQREHFISMLELLSDTVGGKYDKRREYNNIKNKGIKEEETIIKKEVRYIYIKKINSEKYALYNKDSDIYTTIDINMNYNKLFINDINNKKIGELTKNIYNDYFIECNIFPNKRIIAQFMNNYNDVKINIEGDDKYFYIKAEKSDDPYLNSDFNIYLYALKIGIIKKLKTQINKIIVYIEYKKYLNVFGTVFSMLDNIK